jgi:hypothetical protein
MDYELSLSAAMMMGRVIFFMFKVLGVLVPTWVCGR